MPAWEWSMEQGWGAAQPQLSLEEDLGAALGVVPRTLLGSCAAPAVPGDDVGAGLGVVPGTWLGSCTAPTAPGDDLGAALGLASGILLGSC